MQPLSHAPLRLLTDDDLQREGYIRRLALRLRDLSTERGSLLSDGSLVIALYGDWGSGKTTLRYFLEQAVEQLKNEDQRQSQNKFHGLTFIDFSPWEWSAQDKIAEAFFEEIEQAINRGLGIKKKQELAAKWKTLAARFKVHDSFIGAHVSTTNSILFLIGLWAGKLLTDVPTQFGQSQGIWPLIIVSVVTALYAFTNLSKWLTSVSENLAAYYDSLKQPTSDIKDDLKKLLGEQEKTFVVVIDDIDRLLSKEIAQVFQLVKANADFPNIIYLLLCQRDVVEKSLQEIAPISGRDFLEKIVQVDLTVPQPPDDVLKEKFLSRFTQLLQDNGAQSLYDERKFNLLYSDGLHFYLSSLRDIYRLLTSLEFHLALFRRNGQFEVNPVDLVGLETLRMFEPDIYTRLPLEKNLLTSHFIADSDIVTRTVLDQEKQRLETQNMSRHEIEDRLNKLRERYKSDAEKRFETLLSVVPEQRQTIVRGIFKNLFPNLGRLVGAENSSTPLNLSRRQLSVSSPQMFDRYFLMDMPSHQITSAQLQDLIALAGDRNAVITRLEELKDKGQLEDALLRLEIDTSKISEDSIEPFIIALLDIGDSVSNGFARDVPERESIRPICHIITSLLSRYKSNRPRLIDIYRRAMAETGGLIIPDILINHSVYRKV